MAEAGSPAAAMDRHLLAMRAAAKDGDEARAARSLDALAEHIGEKKLVRLGTQLGLQSHGVRPLGQEWPLLHLAAVNNRWRLCELLLRRPAATHSDLDGRRRTALHWAADCGYSRVIRVLLAFGASCEAIDAEGLAPLLLAAANGHTEVVDTLVGAGAAVDCTGVDGGSAMHWAALNGHSETLLRLGRLGCQWNAADRRGRTPLDRLRATERFEASTGGGGGGGGGGGDSGGLRQLIRQLYAVGRQQQAAAEHGPLLAALQRWAVSCLLHRRLGREATAASAAGSKNAAAGGPMGGPTAAVRMVGEILLANTLTVSWSLGPDGFARGRYVPLWLRHQDAGGACGEAGRAEAAAQHKLASTLSMLADSDGGESPGVERRRVAAKAERRAEEAMVARAAKELPAAGAMAGGRVQLRGRQRLRTFNGIDDSVGHFIAPDSDSDSSAEGGGSGDEKQVAYDALDLAEQRLKAVVHKKRRRGGSSAKAVRSPPRPPQRRRRTRVVEDSSSSE